jgi:hypothetical protein
MVTRLTLTGENAIIKVTDSFPFSTPLMGDITTPSVIHIHTYIDKYNTYIHSYAISPHTML